MVAQAFKLSSRIPRKKKQSNLLDPLTAKPPFLSQIIDGLADELMILDGQFKIHFANRTAVRHAGRSYQLLVRKNFFMFMEEPSGIKERIKKELRELWKGKKNIVFTFMRSTPKHGRQMIEAHASLLEERGQKLIVLLLHNITTRHEQHEQIKEEKKKALDNLIMGMTQELEYPLKGLQETSDLLISQYHGRDFEYIGFKEFNAMMKILKKMSDQLKGCSSTIHRLMVLKRKKLGLTHASCNAHNVVREVLRHYSQKLKSLNVEVEFKFNASWPIVAMAAFEFHQIFSNILMNAMQAMPGGGKIHIKTMTIKDRKIFFIECKDEGGGIPEENLSRVFDPFFTTKDHGAERNSGLGLSIVASLIHAHHGEVDIDSRLGEGTTVRMFVPTQKKYPSKA